MPVVENDPFGKIKPGEKQEPITGADVNRFHRNSDVDVGPLAQHHRLGTGANQASPGNHVHDGKQSKLIGTGMNITVLTSSGTVDQKLDRLIDALKQVMDLTEI